MNLKHVLIVDDKLAPGTEHDGEVKVTVVNSRRAAKAVLEAPDPVDLLVLDWILDGDDDSSQAQALMGDLMDIRFIPVLVWTNDEAKFRRECPKEFPKVAYDSVEKLPIRELMEYARDYFGRSFAGKLAAPWRAAVYRALEKSLYDLAQAEVADIRDFLWREQDEDRPVNAANQLLSHVLHEDVEIRTALDNIRLHGEDTPAEDAISRLQAVLSNRVTSDQFRHLMIGALQAEQDAAPAAQEPSALDDLVHAEKYYEIADADVRVRAGDVVEIGIDGQNLLGLVLTPACDMRKTRFLRIVLLEQEDELFPGESKEIRKARQDVRQEKQYHFASLFSLQDGKHYVANFHDLLVVHVPLEAPDQHLWHKQKKFPRLTYDLNFQTRNRQNVTLHRLCRLDDPYRADLIQRFAAHASRIGIPEFRYRG